MTKIKLNQNYFNDLKKIIVNARCSLSGVAVATIIVTDKGIFKGVNYEDCITNLGICAERNAIFNGVTNGMKEIYEIHILTNISDIEMCGACRQVAGSFSKPSTKVYIYKYSTGKRKVRTLGQLMPNAIFPSNKKGK